jgi:hypothetical protein
LSFAFLLGFRLGKCGITLFKNSRPSILGNPFTQKEHCDEDKDYQGRDNLAGEYVCGYRAKKWVCKKSI